MVFYHADGSIFRANDAFLRMSGLERDDVASGRVDWTGLTAPGSAAHAKRVLDEVSAGGCAVPFEREHVRADGTRWWSLSTTTRNDASEFLDFLVELAPAADLRKIAETKGRMLVAVGHDLRQPLHVIAMAHDRLANATSPEVGRQALERARRGTERLGGMLDKLFAYLKLDSGVTVPDREDFPIWLVLAETEESCRPLAREKGLLLTVQRCEDRVTSDPELLCTILLNLVDNAIRYSHAGAVMVSCRRHGDHLTIEVSDSGEGIPPDVIGRNFGEATALKASERSGLGLPIVVKTAAALGHRITVNSAATGSCIQLDLPLAPASSG
jgi:PAS domain S-box-containing protein